jgi:two-component system cell cycle sensor histidine kinase/response regulator CckA
MAAGVAHDFNNLLSVIRLASELIEEQTPSAGAARENFDAIEQAVQRGRGIVNSMLGYARDDGQVSAFAPGALISDAVALLSKPFLSGLVLQMEVDPAAPEVIGRRGRIEQMLLNLVVNAAEAMGGRGALRLRARRVEEASGCVLSPRAAGSYVELSVADSGPGIAPDVLPRIFEPFFTTKNKGAQHGTGLGLSMLYTMAKEDGVGVAVASEVGRGTTFRLVLPVEPAPAAAAPGRDSPVADPSERAHPSP